MFLQKFNMFKSQVKVQEYLHQKVAEQNNTVYDSTEIQMLLHVCVNTSDVAAGKGGADTSVTGLTSNYKTFRTR